MLLQSAQHTLCVQTSFASFVLCNLVQGVFSAVLVFAECPLGLWNVHLRTAKDNLSARDLLRRMPLCCFQQLTILPNPGTQHGDAKTKEH